MSLKHYSKASSLYVNKLTFPVDLEHWKEAILSPGDLRQYLETFLSQLEEGGASCGPRPGTLLNILWCTGQPSRQDDLAPDRQQGPGGGPSLGSHFPHRLNRRATRSCELTLLFPYPCFQPRRSAADSIILQSLGTCCFLAGLSERVLPPGMALLLCHTVLSTLT